MRLPELSVVKCNALPRLPVSRRVRVVAWCGVFAAWAGAARADELIEYNRHIRPILVENCFACHGPDSAARKADLRLDQRSTAVDMGAIVPGDATASELIVRILSDDPHEVMPPPAIKKQLSPTQKDLLKRWIDEGAEYQKHWSLIPPVRPKLPQVKGAASIRNPIDNFILSELERRKLAPAPEADRRTLARRVSLDLTGLPPDRGVVEAFVADGAADAYERLVDRLLESDHWGEHRARYWLDAARYADTHGIHFDNFREMWSYRDWVISAFNRNLPFDRFTIEQLAGDLLPGKTLEQQIASGFNRCNMTTNEGGVIPEEYLVLYTRDRTETTAQVWLGLTAGCAVCHDHKFDPFSQREFYALAAFFNNTTQKAMDQNIKDTPPVVVVPHPQDRDEWPLLQAQLADARARMTARRHEVRPAFEHWLAGGGADSVAELTPREGQRLHIPLSDGEGRTLALTIDGQPGAIELTGAVEWRPGYVAGNSFEHQIKGPVVEVPAAGDFEKDQPFSCGAWVQVLGNVSTGALLARMDDEGDPRGWDLWIELGKVGAGLVHGENDALKVVTTDEIRRYEWTHLFVTYDGTANALGLKIYVNGVPQTVDVKADSLQGGIRTWVPLTLGQRSRRGRIDGLLRVQDVRIYDRELSADEVGRLVRSTRVGWLAGRPPEKRNERENGELFDYWLGTADDVYHELADEARPLEQRDASIRARGTVAHVMNESEEQPLAYVLFRGEYDKRRDPVPADTPAILPPMPDDLPRNRLGFAHWLLSCDHPLTARVTVNRFWQEVFGTGLVKTSGDLGISGELPTHPELLDWLAVEFRESGWDVKRLFRLLVTSATYRQSAAATPEKLETDPHNRWLSRGPRFRMDAEMIRDGALAAGGLLSPRIGGPSVKPYQPPGVWEAVAMDVSNTHKYVQDTGDSLYRRSLYTFWKRAAPPALMEVFNAPNRETCTVRRERTNTPLQALATLNDTTFVEAARHLAQMALTEGGATPDSKIAFVSQRLLARPLRPGELAVVHSSLNELLSFYRDRPAQAEKLICVGESKPDPALEPATLAAWTMLANSLMNLDEVLNK
ncbi:MAG: DUF1553 domain-containing protein [Planctomycetaceae bacterium]